MWARTRWPDATVATLARGRALYANKCGGCHELYGADHRTAEQWPRQVDEMRSRANLEQSERDLIVRYLVTAGRDKHASAAPVSSGGP